MTAIDIFAGCGGSTSGAKAAGVTVLWAANHALLAVKYHTANHPEVIHCCQDLHQADWDETPDADGFLASPDCRGHSPARGKEQPRHDKYRSTAWAVPSLCEAKRPEFGIVENVPGFQNWVLYPSWADAMNRLGYSLAPHVLDSADHGVPQHRLRLYVVCTRSRSPLWLKLPKRPHVPVSSIIDWSAGEWSPWNRLCDRTRQRIKQGRKQFGDRFVAPYYSNGSGLCGRSIDRPIGTITTRDRWQIIDGNRARFLSVEEFRRAMSFPDAYILPPAKAKAKFMLGQAVCPPVITDILNAFKAGNAPATPRQQ